MNKARHWFNHVFLLLAVVGSIALISVDTTGQQFEQNPMAESFQIDYADSGKCSQKS